MEKLGKRTREIRFYSEKNKAMCSVHSAYARDYAKWLEEREDVRGYESALSPFLMHKKRPCGILSQGLISILKCYSV